MADGDGEKEKRNWVQITPGYYKNYPEIDDKHDLHERLFKGKIQSNGSTHVSTNDEETDYTVADMNETNSSPMPPQSKHLRDSDASSHRSSLDGSLESSPPELDEEDSMEGPAYKRAKIHRDIDSPSVLLRDSPMPMSAFVPHNFHIKLENPSPERQYSSDLSPDSVDSSFSSSGSFLPPIPSPLHSPLIGEDGVSAFTKTVPNNKTSPEQQKLSLIKLSQIKSAFTNRSNNRPTSIGQMFALKKRIKQAEMNGDANLTDPSLSPVSEGTDGHLRIKVEVTQQGHVSPNSNKTGAECNEPEADDFKYEEVINAYCKSTDDSEDQVIEDILEELRYCNEDLELNDITEQIYQDENDDTELDETEFHCETDMGEDEDTQPLYPGSRVTTGAFMLLLSLFTMKHNIVGDGIMQLLNIISLVLPEEHRLCTSLHSYRAFFRKLRNPIVYHYYCPFCLGFLENKSTRKCPYIGCKNNIETINTPYFLEMPIEEQIKNFFSQKGFYSNLKGRFNRKNGTYKDIYDGTLYRSYMENNGILNSPHNVSFTLNTDGAPVFKSSKVAIWPLFLVINELPYHLRMMKENMILAGLWFGNHKPAMGTFLHPFLNSFRRLRKGVECVVPGIGSITCKSVLLCGTADLPARSLLCNCVQFNGSFSCWKCLQPGETATRGKGHCHVFPYIHENPKGPDRTKESVLRDAREAMANLEKRQTGYTVNGIKGPSWLTFFPEFNISQGIAIDYMHGVLLGVQKLLLRLWFAPEFKSYDFSAYNHVEEADTRLKNLHPTIEVTRMPRTIQNDLKYWKASEFRSFLLYFGLPVLYGLLDKQRFRHFSLLSNAIHLFLYCGSTDEMINQGEQMMKEFCSTFATLYDRSFMTLNLHQLIHLADSVRCLGPLYTHSCFSFEDKNGFVLKMIRGTQSIDNQIVTGVSFVQKIPELKQKCFSSEQKDVEQLCLSIESPHTLKRGIPIYENTFVLGTVKEKGLTDEEFDCLWGYLGYSPITKNTKYFNRIDIKGHIIYGLNYGRMIKRDNSTIIYDDCGQIHFGKVRFFVILDFERIGDTTLALTECLRCPRYSPEINILSVKETTEIKFINIKNIQEGCMDLSVTNTNRRYVCRYPNKLESD